jgi:hypothetical protein
LIYSFFNGILNLFIIYKTCRLMLQGNWG